jgi:hypothetical protein
MSFITTCRACLKNKKSFINWKGKRKERSEEEDAAGYLVLS